MFAGAVKLSKNDATLEITRNKSTIYQSLQCPQHTSNCEALTVSEEVLILATKISKRYDKQQRFIMATIKPPNDKYIYLTHLSQVMDGQILMDGRGKPERGLQLHEWLQLKPDDVS